MAIPKFLEDLNIISRIGNKPGSDSGLSTPQFKAKFDEGAIKLQSYINETLVPSIENTVPGLYSLTMDLAVLVLNYYDWNENRQTVEVEKVIADTGRQAIISVAGAESLETYLDCNIRMVAQNEGTITFACDDVPPGNVVVNVMILTKGG